LHTIFGEENRFMETLIQKKGLNADKTFDEG